MLRWHILCRFYSLRVSRGICAAFLLVLVACRKEKQKHRGNRSTPDGNPTLHPAPLRRCQHVPPVHQQSHGHHHAEHSGGHIHAIFHTIAFLWLTFSFFLRMVRASPFPQGGSILIQPAAQVKSAGCLPSGESLGSTIKQLASAFMFHVFGAVPVIGSGDSILSNYSGHGK